MLLVMSLSPSSLEAGLAILPSCDLPPSQYLLVADQVAARAVAPMAWGPESHQTPAWTLNTLRPAREVVVEWLVAMA